MKKISTLLLGLMAMGGTAMGQLAPSASTDIYKFNFMGKDAVMLDLFYQALQEGRQYPTVQEFEAKGITKADLEFVRSHVRPHAIMSRADRVVADTEENRNLWMNIPSGSGKLAETGFPSGNFHSDVFSMWNYTNLFGSWNHSIFSAPGAWVDAAHKNGTDIFSGIKFFDTTGGRGQGAGSYVDLITKKDASGNYKYVEPLINILMYLGHDGINYNFEATGYSDPDVIAFHKALYKKAAEKGMKNFHIGMYTMSSSLSAYNANAIFGNKEGRTAETMLNYGGASGANYSAQAAMNAMGTVDGLYQGFWIVRMDQPWTIMNRPGLGRKVGICLWGEHGDSRFWSYNTGKDAYETQINYQKLLERGFSGGNRNPIHRPELRDNGNNWEGDVATGGRLANFGGMASMIPERSAIQGNLPFATHFNLGNGDRYNYKGKMTCGGWYNMANQDIVPTYRWLVVKPETMEANTDLDVQFTHLDAYTGGSCIQLSAPQGATADLVLFKTNLKVSAGNAYANIALKPVTKGQQDTHLKVLLKVNGQWMAARVPALNGDTWQEFKVPLALAAGQVVERIGLRIDNAPAGYDMYVGKLEINDDVQTTPAEVKDFVAEVKCETTKGMALKLSWELDANKLGERDANGMLFNDEGNVDHFEIMYKDGENGRVSEIGRTTQWATVIENIVFKNENEQPFVGVRAVSTDLKTVSSIRWIEIKRASADQLPVLEEIDTYGKSEIDPAADGLETARACRYVARLTTKGATQNLDYSRNEPIGGSQYLHVTDQVLKVKQGQTIELFFRSYKDMTKDDGLKWCVMKGWMDLNGSGDFQPNTIEEDPEDGECLFAAGTVRKGTPEFNDPGVTMTFKIPENAHVGKSRLRMVWTDAWFPNTLAPTGLTAKGLTLDFDVEIEGDPNGQRGYVDTHDQGEAEEPVLVGIDQVVNGGEVSAVKVVEDQLQFQHVEKAWIYAVDGTLVKMVHQPHQVSTQGMIPGVYVVKMFNHNVIRSAKVMVK